MDDATGTPHETDPRRSFGQVADAYERSRPAYPAEAAAWLVGRRPGRVLELGAGTGKLTKDIVALGHRVVATDPSGQMLKQLQTALPDVGVVLAEAEVIPVATRSVDVVVCGQAFHWFDTGRALPEIARVLRPGGVLALVWNLRDERIPWVKRLGSLFGRSPGFEDVVRALDGSDLFDDIETETFRYWQPTDQESLRDLVLSRSQVSVLSERERAEVLGKVDDLYDEFGRGADGMLLPYITHGFRATVTSQGSGDDRPPTVGPDDLDTDALLIDFN